ncbi:MAG: N-acetylglucosamine-6-phosphate deacetylase [Alphaproteobacteria bacterium]|nr:N-acetylglucosamine-6-phosphate deacetylase [Alphaproteobacteria bacterium]
MTEILGRILTPTGFVDGRLHFDARIVEISPAKLPVGAPVILPGFIDLHTPGGGGADALGGEASVRTIARTHARFGTTALLPSPVTAPEAELESAMAGIARVAAKRASGEARVLGAHVEGPFLNPDRLGAQPPFTKAPDGALMDRLLAAGPVRMITLAPELPGATELIRSLTARGVKVLLGHSAASYEATIAALDAGAAGFTHLFNAMSPLHQRAPGMVGAALARAEFAAVIPDLVHVHPGALRAALRAIPRLYGTTDAVAAAGMPDGDYRLGNQRVIKRGGTVSLADGTLAGSALTMDQALRNFVAIGCALDDAARRLSAFPAEMLGLDDRGRIAPGAHADLVVLDAALRVTAVYVEGEAVALKT